MYCTHIFVSWGHLHEIQIMKINIFNKCIIGHWFITAWYRRSLLLSLLFNLMGFESLMQDILQPVMYSMHSNVRLCSHHHKNSPELSRICSSLSLCSILLEFAWGHFAACLQQHQDFLLMPSLCQGVPTNHFCVVQMLKFL